MKYQTTKNKFFFSVNALPLCAFAPLREICWPQISQQNLLLFIALLAPFLLLASCTEQDHSPTPGSQTSQPALNKVDVHIGDRVFHCEIAANDASRQQGLSGRKSLAADAGMIFVFPQSRVISFWMRQCLMPIDVIFLDEGGRVVATHAMPMEQPGIADEQLPLYSSQWPATYAIEVAGGTLVNLPLQTGQKIELPVKILKALAQ